MSKHTPGPWYVMQVDEVFAYIGLAGLHIAKVTDIDTANAQRIVACVNAMEGIDDPAAARVILDMPRTAAATDMLEALYSARRLIDCHCITTTCVGNCAHARINAVINKAEGKE